MVKDSSVGFRNIKSSSKSIYEFDKKLYLNNEVLEELLRNGLQGKSFHGLPLRTRSKAVKSLVCESLGYTIPKSFKRCKPSFPAQDLDIYVQKSNNLQIWNEQIEMDRRYAIVKLSDEDKVVKVKILTGKDIAKYDTTGTITIKYQAILKTNTEITELISVKDTDYIQNIVSYSNYDVSGYSPTDNPALGNILPIEHLFSRLQKLVGRSFLDSGIVQERNRGGELHKLVCKALGYSNFSDNGKFPDILNQLLEVKLQTSPTIDLGAISPNSTDSISPGPIQNLHISPQDIRYAIFYGVTDGATVNLSRFYLTTGKDFYSRFPQMGGNIVNGKLQIPLPNSIFD